MNYLRVIEFFSGIGGWRASLSKLTNNYIIINSFDINPLANIVYNHNYNTIPSNKSIENISPSSLDLLNSNMWLMSPPCQPFTRNNTTNSRDINDPRSKAFIHLIDLLTKIRNPPQYIALENVVGFENSDCCLKFLQILIDLGYQYRQFILTPTQYGIPNSRPRYYLIAIRNQNTIPYQLIPSVLENNNQNMETSSLPNFNEIWTKMDSSVIYSCIPNIVNGNLQDEELIPCQPISNYLIHNEDDSNDEILQNYIIPESVLMKSSSWCFDIVKPSDTHTSCFTKGYNRYIKGTGSILLYKDSGNISLPTFIETKESFEDDKDEKEVKKEDKEDDKGNIPSNIPTIEITSTTSFEPEVKKQKLEENQSSIHSLEYLKGKLRYFTPEELLNLFGFNHVQDDIHSFFPNDNKITLRKKYELIGNSLNVVVASKLIHFMLSNSNYNHNNNNNRNDDQNH